MNGDVELQNIIFYRSEIRSPGLTSSKDHFLTDRIMDHPISNPMPKIDFVSVSPDDIGNRIAVADRLIKAYHKSISDSANSEIKNDKEDLWSHILRSHLSELVTALESGDSSRLAEELKNFGSSHTAVGGINTCIDGYNKIESLDSELIALSYYDKLVCLAESIGALCLENPDHDFWGQNIRYGIDDMVNLIETKLGIKIESPLGIIHTDGIYSSKAVLHYRHINSIYCAVQLERLCGEKKPVCEFGGGLGIVAMYAHRLGYLDYTLLDLPITNVLSGHYLIHALGEDNVVLYGEETKEDAIKILPFWECASLKDKSMGISINQDSFPEISEHLLEIYLKEIVRITKDYFLSINHETFRPKTVHNLVQKAEGFHQLSRSKCWVRNGYVDEVFRIL